MDTEVSGYWIQYHRILDTPVPDIQYPGYSIQWHCIQDTGILDTGYWISRISIEYWILNTESWILDTRSWIQCPCIQYPVLSSNTSGYWYHCILETGILDISSIHWIHGHSILDTGYWYPLSILECLVYWILDTGSSIQYPGIQYPAPVSSIQWILDTGYWILDTGYWILDTGYWILDTW